jgi:hypothetical protein
LALLIGTFWSSRSSRRNLSPNTIRIQLIGVAVQVT